MFKSTSGTESHAFLRLDAVSYQYPSSAKNVFDAVNLSISRGSVTAVVGPSGCGKSTLLKVLGGLLEPTQGAVSVNYKNRKRSVSYSPQSSALLPWLTLQKNLSLLADLRNVGISAEESAKLLGFVGLASYASAKPSELSGGMQTRASLARSLAGAPELLLMDEPFSSLDELTAERIILELSVHLQKNKPTTLFVSHNIAQAVMLADTVLVVSGSPMKVVDCFKVDLPAIRSRGMLESVEFKRAVSEVRASLSKNL